MGEIVVQEFATGRILRGAEALSLVYRQAIAYWLLLPLLWVPYLRSRLDRAVRGDDGGDSHDDSMANTSTHIGAGT
jgi:hypothetical protein